MMFILLKIQDYLQTDFLVFEPKFNLYGGKGTQALDRRTLDKLLPQGHLLVQLLFPTEKHS